VTGHGSLLVGTPDGGSVDAVAGLAEVVGEEADWRSWQAAEVRVARDALRGEGQAVGAVRDRLTELAGRLDELGAACGRVRDVVRRYAGDLADVQARAGRLRDAEAEAVARAQRYRAAVLAGDPTLGRPPWQRPPLRSALAEQRVAWELAQWRDAVGEHDDVTRAWNALVDERGAMDDAAAAALDGVPDLQPLRTRVAGTGGAVAVAATLWSNPHAIISADDLVALGDADAVRAVWDQLGEVQRRSLISTEPAVTGNLDGIPIQFRAEANRLNMRAEIARIDRVLDATKHSPPHVEFMYGESVEELRALRESYTHYLESPQEVYGGNGLPIRVVGIPVVVFDPGAAAIATYHGPFDANGDVPSWVVNIAVHVPGTGTTMSSFRRTDDRSLDIYKRGGALTASGEAGPSAVFAWAGGRFPQGLEAVYDGFSRDLGPRLRDFAAAVDRHPATSTLTITGHSYGAAVVGIAESVGLRADRVLYVAGAGIGNDNTEVADFPHTGDVPHYALMARNDAIVGYIQGADFGALGHGASPLLDPDVTRLETGFLDRENPVRGQDIESLGDFESHSGVYTVGSTSFENIVQTIVGGRVETFAPDEVRIHHVRGQGAQLTTTKGIDRPGYVPLHVQVK
jgi:hypothetical protein